MAHLIWQVTVDALGMSMIYVLLAVGLNLIITTTRIVLVAYGNFYMIGAYAVWFFSVSLKIPYFISLAIAGLITAALGVVVYFAIFRHTQRREQRFLSDLTAALGLMMILGQVAVLFFGSAPKSIPPAFPGKLSVIGATITYERLIVILLGIAMTVVLALFLQRTNLGRALRTVAVNTDIAALLGVNWNRVYLVTMAVGCALAGLAGGLIAPLFPIAQTMGGIILVVLLVVLFGGMGSMLGVSLGALIFGLSQSYGQAFIGTGVAQIVVYVVVAGVIFFRPGGVFGKAGLDTTFT